MPTPVPAPEQVPSSPAEDVLDRLPYGVVVVHAGEVKSATRPPRGCSGASTTGGPPAHCHELFACRAPGGPCEDGCLAERAALSDSALPEIRIDTAQSASATALWVTAAPLAARRHRRPPSPPR